MPWPCGKQPHTQAQPEPELPQVHTDGPAPLQALPLSRSVESCAPLNVSVNPSRPVDSPQRGPEEHAAPPSAPTPLPTNSDQADEHSPHGKHLRADSGPFPPPRFQVENDAALRSASQPSPGPIANPSGDENAAGAWVARATLPAKLLAGPDKLVERVRDALLEADTRGTRECPKTFADFTRWLKTHNEDRVAALYH